MNSQQLKAIFRNQVSKKKVDVLVYIVGDGPSDFSIKLQSLSENRADPDQVYDTLSSRLRDYHANGFLASGELSIPRFDKSDTDPPTIWVSGD